MNTHQRRLIRTDGTTELLDTRPSKRALPALIGAQSLTFIALRNLGEPVQVLVTDSTAEEKGLPLNEPATRLYEANGEARPIHGDVAVVLDGDLA